MYSSDWMKTLIRMYYDKWIVFRECQMPFFNIYLKRKEIFLICFCHIVEFPVKIQSLLDYFWDVSRDLGRLQSTTTQIWKGKLSTGLLLMVCKSFQLIEKCTCNYFWCQLISKQLYFQHTQWYFFMFICFLNIINFVAGFQFAISILFCINFSGLYCIVMDLCTCPFYR